MATKKMNNTSENKATQLVTSRKEQNRRKSDDFKQYYCNSTSLMFSVWDAVITFGQTIRSTGGEIEGFEENFDVIMSHAHFKTFVKILSDNLAAIEEKYGEIQILDLQNKDDKNDEDSKPKPKRA